MTPALHSASLRAPAVLLACTGRFDCSPVVGFACCKPNANACNSCKPP